MLYYFHPCFVTDSKPEPDAVPIQPISTYWVTRFRLYRPHFPFPLVREPEMLTSNNNPHLLVTRSARTQFPCSVDFVRTLKECHDNTMENIISDSPIINLQVSARMFLYRGAPVAFIISWLSGGALAPLDQPDLEGTFTFQSCQVFNHLVSGTVQLQN